MAYQYPPELIDGSYQETAFERTRQFPSKEAVFEMLDDIPTIYKSFYEGTFGLPQGSALTDEEIEKYKNFILLTDLLNSITLEQAKTHKIRNIHFHPDFKLADFTEESLSIDIRRYFATRNIPQEDLISYAKNNKFDLFTIKSNYQIVSKELFDLVSKPEDITYDYYLSSANLVKLKENATIEKMIKRTGFTKEYFKELRSFLGCSVGDILWEISKVDKEALDKLDYSVKKFLKAMALIYK